MPLKLNRDSTKWLQYGWIWNWLGWSLFLKPHENCRSMAYAFNLSNNIKTAQLWILEITLNHLRGLKNTYFFFLLKFQFCSTCAW